MANGLKTLISANAVCPRKQKPLADTSDLASFDVIAEVYARISPLSGCNDDSGLMSLQISLKISTVKSRVSLCRPIMYPPLGHESACYTLNDAPQTHDNGIRWRGIL